MITRRFFLTMLIAMTIIPSVFAREPGESRSAADWVFGPRELPRDAPGEGPSAPQGVPPGAGLDEPFSLEERQRLRQDVEGWSRGMHRHRPVDPRRREAVRRRIAEHFHHFDANGDGALDREEMRRAFPRIAERFHLVDGDGDGRVTEGELEAAARRRAERRFAPMPKE